MSQLKSKGTLPVRELVPPPYGKLMTAGAVIAILYGIGVPLWIAIGLGLGYVLALATIILIACGLGVAAVFVTAAMLEAFDLLARPWRRRKQARRRYEAQQRLNRRR